MFKALKLLKPFILSKVLYGIVQMLSWSTPKALIRYLNIAEKATNREHYKRAIRRIKDMWKAGHPSIKVAIRILKDTSPKHKKQIIKCFIINQLIVGSSKRKLFSENEGGFYPLTASSLPESTT